MVKIWRLGCIYRYWLYLVLLVPGVCRPYQPKPYDDDDDNDADHLRTKYPTGIDIIIFDWNGVAAMG